MLFLIGHRCNSRTTGILRVPKLGFEDKVLKDLYMRRGRKLGCV
jgi:hypothetical protein